MVVGIRHTSNAISSSGSSVTPTKPAIAGNDATTIKKNVSVIAASNKVSAISFGVFCRLAPSTNAIMRSESCAPARR